jgi:hypothetical protein
MNAINVKRVVVRRLVPGADLLEELNKLVKVEGIELGALSGIGALRKAAVGIFDLEKGEYKVNEFDEEMEICALTGNVSLKEGALGPGGARLWRPPDARVRGLRCRVNPVGIRGGAARALPAGGLRRPGPLGGGEYRDGVKPRSRLSRRIR